MAPRDSLTYEKIEEALSALDSELEQRKFPFVIEMMIVGGVYMVIQVGNRQSTEDMDVVLSGISLSYEPLFKEAKIFRAAVKAAGKSAGISTTWLNDDAATFIQAFAPDPQPRHWKTYSKLRLWLPSVECILASKMICFREKDRRDVCSTLPKAWYSPWIAQRDVSFEKNGGE